MTTAAAGILGFGPQAVKDTAATQFYRHRATAIDLDIADDVREGIPEVGGSALPTFPYKGGPVVAGGFTLQPRFEDVLGWLLYGALGDHTPSGAGPIYDHAFAINGSETTYVPWLSFRKSIPRRDATADTDLGQLMYDCKVVGATLALPNDAPLTMRVDVLGRKFALDHDPSVWTWENSFEDWESIPVACSVGGYLKIDNVELPVIAANVAWQNVPGDMRVQKVFGDPYLEDVEIVQRRMAYDLTVKWTDPDLYAQCLTGNVVGTTWSAHPYTAAFEVKAVSSVNMTGQAEPYSLKIEVPEIMMSQVGGIALAGNQSVLMRFQGVALETAAPEDYAVFTLRNLVSDYVWPVAGSGS